MSKALYEFVAETGQWGLELYGQKLEETQDPNKALLEARRAYNRQPTPPPTEDDEVWKLVDQHSKRSEPKAESKPARELKGVGTKRLGPSPFRRKCLQGVNTGKPGPCPSGIGDDARPDKPDRVVSGVSGRALAAAEKIKFSDETVGGEDIGQRDYDAIEATMDRAQRQDMEAALEEARDAAVNDAMDNFEPDVDEYHAATKAGFSDEEVAISVREMIQEHGGDEAARLEEELEEWYRDYEPKRSNGEDVVYDMFRSLSDMPDDLKESLSQYVDDAAEKIKDEIQEQYDEQEASFRTEAENDYDDSEDRVEYLRQFYRDNPSQMSGGGADQEDDTWYKDSDGDYILTFSTSAGNEYKINVITNTLGGEEVPTLSFSDEDGGYGVTGRGHAFEVFSKVTAATTAYVMKNDPTIITFTAQGESRQSLYDKLVKTISKALPEYSAVAVIKGKVRHYAVVKRDEKEAWMDKLRSVSDEQVEELVKAFRRKVRTLGGVRNSSLTTFGIKRLIRIRASRDKTS